MIVFVKITQTWGSWHDCTSSLVQWLVCEWGKSGSFLYLVVFVRSETISYRTIRVQRKNLLYVWECFTAKANSIVLMIRSVFYCLNDPEPKMTVGYRFPPKQRKSNRHLILKVHSTSSFMRQSLKCLHQKSSFPKPEKDKTCI